MIEGSGTLAVFNFLTGFSNTVLFEGWLFLEILKDTNAVKLSQIPLTNICLRTNFFAFL